MPQKGSTRNPKTNRGRIDRSVYGLTPEYAERLRVLMAEHGYDRVIGHGYAKCPLWTLPGGLRKHDHPWVSHDTACHPSNIESVQGIWDHVVILKGPDKRGLLAQPYPGRLHRTAREYIDALIDTYDVRVMAVESPYGHGTVAFLIEDPWGR